MGYRDLWPPAAQLAFIEQVGRRQVEPPDADWVYHRLHMLVQMVKDYQRDETEVSAHVADLQTACAAAQTAEQAARRQLQAALTDNARLRARQAAHEAAIAGLVARLDAAGLGDPTGELAAIRAVLARVGEDGS